MTDPQAPSADPTRRNFYGRVHGKTMRPGHKALLAEALGPLELAGVGFEENPERAVIAVPGGPLWLEIGFGSGEHLVHMARANPGVTLIGAEVYLTGVATVLAKLEREPLTNVRLLRGDVRDLLEVLPAGCLERAFLNYPDPWPKARHHRRRFVTPEALGLLAAAMASGAEFRVATDIEDYVRQTLEEVPRAGFVLVAGPVAEAWVDWPSTRYEAKALREGREPRYLTFRRA